MTQVEGSKIEVEQRFVFNEEQRAKFLLELKAKLKLQQSFVNLGFEHLKPTDKIGVRVNGLWLRARIINPDKAQVRQVITAHPEERLSVLARQSIPMKWTLKVATGIVGANQELEDASEIAEFLQLKANDERELLTALDQSNHTVDAGFFTDRVEYKAANSLTITTDDSQCIHTGIPGQNDVVRRISEVEYMVNRGQEQMARDYIRNTVREVLGAAVAAAEVPSTIIACIAAHRRAEYIAQLLAAKRVTPKQLAVLYRSGEFPLEKVDALLPVILPETRESLRSTIVST